MIYVLIFLQQAIASMTHIIGQDVARESPPPLILLLRATIASAILLAVTMISQKKRNLLAGWDKKDIVRLFVIGFLNIPINQFLYLEGLRFTTPANSALLYALTPVIVFICALVVHRERENWKKWLGIALALGGTALLIFERGASLSSEYTKGNILIFIAVIAWSLFTFLGKPLIEKYGALTTTTLHMVAGTILYIPMGLLLTDVAKVATLSSTAWWEVLYLAIGASCINYFLWYYALGKLETSRVAIFQNLQPVLTTVIALILGKVILTDALLGGGIMTLIGILIVQFA
jgi:drug/metabolite transporter (DMT)-like permease